MAPSQGSFSLSHKILDAFMCEFESELASKVGKLDTALIEDYQDEDKID